MEKLINTIIPSELKFRMNERKLHSITLINNFFTKNNKPDTTYNSCQAWVHGKRNGTEFYHR